MIVMKFGGTSLGNAEAFRKVADIIKSNHDKQPFVVVSAVGGVTDLLIDSAKAVIIKEKNVDEAMKIIRKKHIEILTELKMEKSSIDSELEELKRVLDGIYLINELTERTMDYVMSFGERMSSKMLASYLSANGTDAKAYTGWDIGIVTNSEFNDAKPLPESKENVKKSLSNINHVPVITGFIAKDGKGEITTLGRGGSDFTASLVGAYLGAKEVWIWTDVDGVLTADPRIVKNAKLIRRISYNEASELSYFGAKVIHPKTVWPAVENGIPLRIKNTFNPEGEGTVITKEKNLNGKSVRAATAIKDLSIINVVGTGMEGVPGIAAKIFSAVSASNANVLMISQASSEHTVCFVINEKDRKNVLHQLNKELKSFIEKKIINKIISEDNRSILTIVGDGMHGLPGTAAKFCSALAEEKINIIAIAQGSSELSISVVINQEDVSKAVNKVHSAFELG